MSSSSSSSLASASASAPLAPSLFRTRAGRGIGVEADKKITSYLPSRDFYQLLRVNRDWMGLYTNYLQASYHQPLDFPRIVDPKLNQNPSSTPIRLPSRITAYWNYFMDDVDLFNAIPSRHRAAIPPKNHPRPAIPALLDQPIPPQNLSKWHYVKDIFLDANPVKDLHHLLNVFNKEKTPHLRTLLLDYSRSSNAHPKYKLKRKFDDEDDNGSDEEYEITFDDDEDEDDEDKDEANPNDLKHLHIHPIEGTIFDLPLSPPVPVSDNQRFPNTVKVFSLGEYFNHPLSFAPIPLEVETLIVGAFDSARTKQLYPRVIDVLVTGQPYKVLTEIGGVNDVVGDFNQPIKNDLKRFHSLRHLFLGYNFDDSLVYESHDVSVLPDSLETFSCGSEFDQPISDVVFKSTNHLTRLFMGGSFNQPLAAGVLPATLQFLYMSSRFDQEDFDLRHCSTLVELYFPSDGRYHYPIHDRVYVYRTSPDPNARPQSPLRVLHLPSGWPWSRAVRGADLRTLDGFEAFTELIELRLGIRTAFELCTSIAHRRQSQETYTLRSVFPSLQRFQVIGATRHGAFKIHTFNPVMIDPIIDSDDDNADGFQFAGISMSSDEKEKFLSPERIDFLDQWRKMIESDENDGMSRWWR